ncbi:unnamed protein product [Spirodela intermedia]|uniref:Uncharacterized protein n=2 Tax=Spirodela intermedia TaxID=51605 RepID=A0A7I8LG06_SPIIN|nr:unnamed protein product [Spirodela intermedia]CAA6671127.1 unnamed protein product [Spirodela intermedia]CAA7408238.1 unnamed protein product [Spirodela intermedia]
MSPAEGPTVVFKGQVTPVTADAASVASGPAVYGGVAAFLRVVEEWRSPGKWEEEEESSSIGVDGEGSLSSSPLPGDEDQEEHDEEVQSRLKNGVLASLGSLEVALPVKRGLSNCFSGKSKSFASLSEAASLCSAGDLAKTEHPINKRRRITMAFRASWQRRASSATLTTSNLRVLAEEEEEHSHRCPSSSAALPTSPDNFKSSRSFSLSDLQHA